MARLTTTIEVVTDGGDGEDSQKPEVAEEPEKQNNPEPILASKTKSNKFDIIDAIRLRLSTADKRSRRQIMRQLKIMVRLVFERFVQFQIVLFRVSMIIKRKRNGRQSKLISFEKSLINCSRNIESLRKLSFPKR